MKIQEISSAAFKQYGVVVEGYDFSEMLELLNQQTLKPADHVIYQPGDEALEALESAKWLETNFYGGMPIQVGYCNGYNRTLNCLEYHRGTEVNIAADDVVLLLAPKERIENNMLDTAEVEAFLLPAGRAVALYETALHYAPCCTEETEGFRVIVVLPKDTNTEKPVISVHNAEDKLLWARNKWLMAHPDSSEAAQGAWAGLKGANLSV